PRPRGSRGVRGRRARPVARPSGSAAWYARAGGRQKGLGEGPGTRSLAALGMSGAGGGGIANQQRGARSLAALGMSGAGGGGIANQQRGARSLAALGMSGAGGGGIANQQRGAAHLYDRVASSTNSKLSGSSCRIG